MEHAAIRTRGLTKTFGTLTALDGLDLEVAVGEVFGYLGPNGAGKTTTIRLLLDLLRPSAGTVEVLGRHPSEVALRHDVGYLPAEARFDPAYTGRDVIEVSAALRGVDTRFADTLCERFDLDPGRRITELSTGNRRKVAIVHAFLHRPRLLILDEPTSGLDPLLQEELHHLVREELAGGATVFLSSHVLPEVEALANRVAILRAGRLALSTDLAELRARARQRIDLYVEEGADPTGFEGVPGVLEVRATPGIVHLVVEGSVAEVVRVAASLDVHRWVTHETDLEEVFLGLYG